MYGARILVLIPHPDDEVLGAALAIREAVRRGAVVTGLDLTHGCPPREALWPWQRASYDARVRRRRAEAAEAASMLGIARLADDGLASRCLYRHLAKQFERARNALDTTRADTLWVPAYEGAHADHDVANAIAAALRRSASGLAVWEFAVYNWAQGRLASNAFIAPRGGETFVDPENDEVGRWKSAVLGCYRSERANLANVSDGRVFREAFRPRPEYDYGRPPHAGRLFYERFHWVPFRHPRIDFTSCGDVSAAIQAFLAGRAPGQA